jgi:biopolymer transport protein ExbD
MPKIKMPKGAPSLDMTPMVDLAFLLVTFFMLTASFREAETVTVVVPDARSVADKELPKNTLIITVSKTGQVYYDVQLEGPTARLEVLDSMMKNFNFNLDDQGKMAFLRCGAFAVSPKKLPEYLRLTDYERLQMNKKYPDGLSTDSLNNEIGALTLYGMEIGLRNFKERKETAKMEGVELDRETLNKIRPRISIKADFDAPYLKVKSVIKALTDKKLYQFTLITTLDQA